MSIEARKKKLEIILNQWKEILNKEMSYSPDLRDQDRAMQAFKMVLKLECEIKEL